MRAQTQPGSSGCPRGERLHSKHLWLAKGYWVSKKGHFIRREKGPEIRRGKELKTYFAYFTLLPLFDVRSANSIVPSDTIFEVASPRNVSELALSYSQSSKDARSGAQIPQDLNYWRKSLIL